MRIGAKVGDAINAMKHTSNSITQVEKTIEKLNSKKVDIVANDSNVLRVKSSIEEVEKKIDDLKNKKAEIALKIDKNKEKEIRESIQGINAQMATLREQKKVLKMKIKATTDKKELEKLNKELEETEKNMESLSEQKLELRKEFEEVKEANNKLNQELRETDSEIKKLNRQKLDLKDELKETEQQAYETNNAIQNIEKTVKKINGTQLKIKHITEKREILKTEIMGDVQKVAAMGVGLGGVAYGINRVNQETVQMANLADTVGLSFGTVNTLGSAVRGIGLNYESVTDIMEELNNKIGESKVVYKEWLKEDKLKGKELKLVGGVDDAFKGLDFSLSDKSFKGLDYEKTFQKFTKLKGDKQFELVIDTALKMKDEQKAASMVDILMGGEANKILSFLRKQGLSYKQFMEQKEKLNFLDDEGLKGAKAYAKVSAQTGSIVGSIFKQISGVGGGYMTPVLEKFNNWLVLNKKIVQLNIKGFFEGFKSSMETTGEIIDAVSAKLKPLTNLLGITSDEANVAGESGERFGKALGYIGAGVAGLVALKIAMGTTRLVTNYATGAVNLLRLSYLKLNGAVLAARGATIAQTLSLANLGKVAKATNKILFASPWGALIAGLALGAVVIRKYWEPIKGFFEGVAIGIAYAFEPIKETFMSVFETVKPIIYPFIGFVKIMGTMLKTIFSDVFEYIGGLIEPVSAVSDSVTNATEAGKKFGAWIGIVGAGVVGVLALKSAFVVLAPAIGAVGAVLAFVSRALLMNPIGLAVTAIAGGAYLIYSNWESITGWFSAKMESVKAVFNLAWSGIQGMFLSVWSSIKSGVSFVWEDIKTLFNWSPLGVLVNNWQPIVSFVSGIGTGAKNLLNMAWEGLKSIVSWNPIEFVSTKWNGLMNFFANFSLKEAGAKIISSVIDGMSATWQKLVKKVGDITKSIRDFFPFSPAKKGALSDIHKVKLMETVADSINEKPLLKAVNDTTGKVRKSLAMAGAGMALGGTLAVAEPAIPDVQETEKSAVFQKVLETKENLLPSALPALENRTFDTLEILQLSNIDAVSDRTFQTKEVYSQANIPSVKNKLEEMEAPKPFTVSEQEKTPKEASITHHHNNNSQIHVSIGDIIVQASPEGGVANPEILKDEIMGMVEDGIRQAQNNTQDTQFSDIGGLG
jgi:predicted  nucleic acid-binding Zn-ribbon protein